MGFNLIWPTFCISVKNINIIHYFVKNQQNGKMDIKPNYSSFSCFYVKVYPPSHSRFYILHFIHISSLWEKQINAVLSYCLFSAVISLVRLQLTFSLLLNAVEMTAETWPAGTFSSHSIVARCPNFSTRPGGRRPYSNLCRQWQQQQQQQYECYIYCMASFNWGVYRVHISHRH